MKIKNNFVLNIPSYIKPSFRISPFRTESIEINRVLSEEDNATLDNYLIERFKTKEYIYTLDGRSAIEQALSALDLKKDDTVTIFTTTNNLYISSCVTSKIEAYCKWSRKIEKNTKAILLNHEFGYCVEDMEYYQSLGFPIIEDFAHSFSSSNSFNNAGEYADFQVFSLSKIFPMQLGGVLVYNKQYKIKSILDISTKEYMKNVASDYIKDISIINQKRLENYKYYNQLFNSINIKSTLELTLNTVPAVFMFDLPKEVNLNYMKEYVNNHGIESSVFYGKHSYFVPNHQNLSQQDIEYIFTVVKSFLESEIK